MTNTTSRAYENIVDEIRRGFAKPKDLENAELLFGQEIEPVLLAELTESEREAYSLKALHMGPSNKFFSKPSTKNDEEDEIIWNTEEGRRGFVVDGGRFVLGKSPKKQSRTMWFVQARKKQMLGPFTLVEMKEKLRNNELENSMVKREKDPFFLCFKKIQKSCPTIFDDEKGIEELFAGTAQETARKDVSVPKEEKITSRERKEMTEDKLHSLLEGCTKSKAFLLRKKSRAGIIEVEKGARDLDKAACLKIISEVTGMKKVDSEAFLELFLGESKLGLCCNVDDDGFEAVDAGF